MTKIVPVIMIALTFVILIAGVILMTLGNRLNIKYSNKIMSMRVIMQALTVLALAALYYIQKKGF